MFIGRNLNITDNKKLPPIIKLETNHQQYSLSGMLNILISRNEMLMLINQAKLLNLTGHQRALSHSFLKLLLRKGYKMQRKGEVVNKAYYTLKVMKDKTEYEQGMW